MVPSRPLIIVAEDEGVLRLVVTIGLEDCGFQVLEAVDGQAAWELLRARPDCRLIVSDVRMPRMDGYVLAHRVLSLEVHPPILLLTGYADPLPEYLKNRITLLPKPVPLEVLCERAKSICGNPNSTPH